MGGEEEWCRGCGGTCWGRRNEGGEKLWRNEVQRIELRDGVEEDLDRLVVMGYAVG